MGGLRPKSKPKVGIGRSIRDRQLMVGLGFIHGLTAALQVGPGVQGRLPDLVERRQLIGEIEWAGDVELLDRRAVVQQSEQLNLRRAQIDFRRLQVGFILHALQFQPVQVHLRDAARLVALAIYLQQPVVVCEIFLGEIQDGLLLQRLHEGHAQIEQQHSFQVRLVRDRDRGRLLRALQPQLALTPALQKIASTCQGRK